MSGTEGTPGFLKINDVSSYDLIAHPDYNFIPGLCVMRIGEDDKGDTGSNVLSRIGRITRVDAAVGKIAVDWLDGSCQPVWPTAVVSVFPSELEGGSDEDEDSLWESEETDSSQSSYDEDWTSEEEGDVNEKSSSFFKVEAQTQEIVSTALERLRILSALVNSVKETDDPEGGRMSITVSLLQFEKELLQKKGIRIDECKRYRKESKLQIRLLKIWLRLAAGKPMTTDLRYAMCSTRVSEFVKMEKSLLSKELSESQPEPEIQENGLKGADLKKKLSEDKTDLKCAEVYSVNPAEDRVKFIERILRDSPAEAGLNLWAEPRSRTTVTLVDMLASSLIGTLDTHLKRILTTLEAAQTSYEKMDVTTEEESFTAVSSVSQVHYIGTG